MTRGEIPQAEVSSEISRLAADVRTLLDEGRTPLPESADLRLIDDWAIAAQHRHWGWA